MQMAHFVMHVHAALLHVIYHMPYFRWIGKPVQVFHCISNTAQFDDIYDGM